MSVVIGLEEKECETCGGTGEVMEMKCYGGAPTEHKETCLECEGEGVIK